LFCNPNNPTGQFIKLEDIKKVVEVCGNKNTKTSNKNLSVVKFKTTNSKKRASYNSSSSYRHSYSSGICGALTKKGGTCSRRVSGGGRCWQH